MKKVFLIFFFSLILLNVKAATIESLPGIWNWSNTAAWVGSIVPGADDSVVISNGSSITLDVNTTVKSITISSKDDSVGSLIIHANLSIKNTIGFIGNDYRHKPAGLILNDTVPRKVLIYGDFICTFTGYTGITNAEHVLEIQGNITLGSSFADSTGIVKLTGTNYSTITSDYFFLYKMEIGDGIKPKTVECEGLSYGVYFIPNGYLQVNRFSTFYFNNHYNWNEKGAANVSLNIVNDATVYTNGSKSIWSYNSLIYFTYLNNNVPEDSIKRGNLYIGENDNVLPPGTIGNLNVKYHGTGQTCYANISGSGPRAFTILGDLNIDANSMTFGTGYGAKDAGNVTINFKGSAKPVNSINFQNVGNLEFDGAYNTINPSKKYKVLISGNYEIRTTHNAGTNGHGTIGFYNFSVADDASIKVVQNKPDNFIVSAKGDLAIGNNAIINLKAVSNEWHIQGNPGRYVNYTGNGTLKINQLVTDTYNSSGANVTINIEIYNEVQQYAELDFSSFVWQQTAGRLYISFPNYDYLYLYHEDTSHDLILNDLEIGKNTKLYFPLFNATKLDIKGNLTLDDSAEWDYANSNNGIVSFNGSAPQTIKTSVFPLSFSNMQVKNIHGLTLNGALTIQNNFFSQTPALLDLNNNSIITIGNSSSLTIKASAKLNAQIINYGNNAFINGPLRVITKSTEQDSVAIAKNFTFPIGKIVNGQKIFAPIAIKNISGYSEVLNNDPSDDDNFKAEYFYSSSPNLLQLSDSLKGVSKIEYWNIKRSTGSMMKGNIELFWQNKTRSDIFNKGRHYLKVTQSIGGIWHDKGNTYPTSSRMAALTDSITSTDTLTTFNDVSFGSTDLSINPLGNHMKPANAIASHYITFNIYPNPASNKIHIVLYCIHATTAEIKISNVKGDLVQIIHTSLAEGRNEKSINITSFCRGAYLISVYTKDEHVINSRLIVQ